MFSRNLASEPGCALCETQTALYVLNSAGGQGERVIQAVCRFCYIRLAGKRPPQRLRVELLPDSQPIQ